MSHFHVDRRGNNAEIPLSRAMAEPPEPGARQVTTSSPWHHIVQTFSHLKLLQLTKSMSAISLSKSP